LDRDLAPALATLIPLTEKLEARDLELQSKTWTAREFVALKCAEFD